MKNLGIRAKAAAGTLAIVGTDAKNRALARIADALIARQSELLAANLTDMEAARANAMRPALLDRLELTPTRLAAIADGVRQVAALDDPTGSGEVKTRPNGLIIEKRSVPLGVIGFIYEARPNVTADAAALCLKSGNAVILRGSKDAFHSNKAIVALIRDCLKASDLPEDAVLLVEDTSRESAAQLMNLTGCVDALIPRGGAGLIKSVVENSRVPVIETGSGICHLYVDASADQPNAVEIAFNAKCQRPSVCNAIEQLLVHRDIAAQFLPTLKAKLDEAHTELRGDPESVRILNCKPAAEEDFRTEFGDYILALKVVGGVDEAIAHINATGTGHSEAILTNDYANAQKFLAAVDAAAVYVNASTRFTDGFEFGLGAELGISTQKLHARGPMGLRELTSSKFVIYGSGQIRQ
ncbi:MAG: glutamate-5-semialdehyde dehydrogenase [Oscillospiraceae bacterium]|jgi:glutamate-5-semialdehyde dehydrogenase|nr:glutamate-5-semialdehyde dehydrogenase [Oscillospiraceae bacterium]